MQTITIIGGGYCGTMTAVHLLQQCSMPVHIVLVNAGNPIAKGIAYSTYSESHLLNVIAGKMSAWPGDAGHFVNWVSKTPGYQDIDPGLLAYTFLPRALYGHYLEEIWQHALAHKPGHVRLTVHENMALDIRKNEHGYAVALDNGTMLDTDIVVIATGNSAPRNPPLADKSFYASPHYYANPWHAGAVSNIENKRDILIVGNGLTMVDTLLGLRENGFTQNIYSLSPNGFAILPHRHTGMVYTRLTDELKEPYDLLTLLSLSNKHIKIVRRLGLSAEPVIDSLRQHTQKIWQALTPQERRLFYVRLRHFWGVARHRVPIHIHDKLQQMRISNKLRVIAGRITAITETAEGIRVEFYNKKAQENQHILVERVINCTGPESDINYCDNPLLRNLAQSGTLVADDLAIGVMADVSTGQVYSHDGKLAENMYTMGTNLKGILWESTAIPELRTQAESVARHIAQRLAAMQSARA